MNKDSRTPDLPQWMIEDNHSRQGKYARNMDDEAFLAKMNHHLQPYEEDIEVPEEEPFPIIYFFGLPRCGKTVFSQLLRDSLDIGYPDNVVARFWRAPVSGIRLSSILNTTADKTDYQSDYGKTGSLSDPHDFAYFWRKWFHMDSLDYDPDEARNSIDFKGLGDQLRKMSKEWGKTSVFKGVIPSYHLKNMLECYQKSLVIYVDRDYIDSAVSLLKGRIDNYNDPDHWYGQTVLPEQMNELRDLPWNEQIGGQFYYLNKLYEKCFGEIDQNKLIRIAYHEFCDDPNGTIQMIVDRVKDLYDYKIPVKNIPQKESFKFSMHKEDANGYQELIKGLEKYGMKTRRLVMAD